MIKNLFKNNLFIICLHIVSIIFSITITTYFTSNKLNDEIIPIRNYMDGHTKKQIEINEVITTTLPKIGEDVEYLSNKQIRKIKRKVGIMQGRMKIIEERINLADDAYIELIKEIEQNYPPHLYYNIQ